MQTISLHWYLFLAGCLSFLLNLFGISECECTAASDIQVGTTLIEISVICTSLVAFPAGYFGALEACRRVGAMNGDQFDGVHLSSPVIVFTHDCRASVGT